MSKIKKVYVACYKYDISFWTEVCIASIRYWYPNIPICLIKDYLRGDFDTSRIEQCWNVSVLQTKRKKFGWGFSKLEPLFLNNHERVLILDADIVFLGKVIDALESFDEDFIISGNIFNELQLSQDDKFYIKKVSFDIDKLLEFDPEYIFPGFVFNSGQMVATCGKISRSDFSGTVDWHYPPMKKHKDIFSLGTQGIVNYVLTKKLQCGQISVRNYPFMRWPISEPYKRYSLPRIKKQQGYPVLMHWAGIRDPAKGKRYLKILKFYHDVYHSKVNA